MKKVEELTTDELNQLIQQLEWEKEHLEYRISKAEQELYYRKYPEIRPTNPTN